MRNIKQWLMAMRQTPTWRAVKNESVGFAPEKTPRTRGSRAVLNVAVSMFLLFGAVNISFASTPDGQTPAQEDVCKQAGLSGKLYGLCNAYCEAQDCDLASQADKKSCGVLRSNFIKLGGTSLPCDKRAAVTIDKYVAGHRADDNTDLGPDLIVGQPLIWNVEIKNTGDFPLDPVTVTDNISGLNCNGITTLGIGDTLTCTLEDIVKELQQSNTANVTATASNGSVVTGSDTSSYFGLASGITITKVTDKPTYEVGEPIVFTFTITNTGQAALKNLSVLDNHATPADLVDDFDPCVGVIDGMTVLAGGASLVCTFSSNSSNAATVGTFTNIATVSAITVIGDVSTGNTASADFEVKATPVLCPCGAYTPVPGIVYHGISVTSGRGCVEVEVDQDTLYAGVVQFFGGSNPAWICGGNTPGGGWDAPVSSILANIAEVNACVAELRKVAGCEGLPDLP